MPLNTVNSVNLPQPQFPLAPAAVSVAGTTTPVLPANPNRTGLVLINTSGNVISVAFGNNAAVLNSGITLEASGGTFVMDYRTFTTLAVSAIASAGSSNLAIQEFS